MGQGLAASLGIGAALGLSAGLTPGPLLALVVSQALAHGVREGLKVAFVPILTDIPIVLASLFVLSRFSESRLILGLISAAGGTYLLRLGCRNLRTPPRAER
ncbi:MAG TPA: LysE family transporter, partial [bacterium]|nr:LysE family transporter [bacterium]